MRVLHQGGEHLLQLHTREVALLFDVIEAALPAEAISGPKASNPSLSQFVNAIYAELIETARQGWAEPAADAAQAPEARR